MSPIRNLLDILITLGGLAMGAVLSVLMAVTVLIYEMMEIDHTTLALTWSLVAFVFAIGFITAKRQFNKEQESMEKTMDVLR